jgi:hypothetical protein
MFYLNKSESHISQYLFIIKPKYQIVVSALYDILSFVCRQIKNPNLKLGILQHFIKLNRFNKHKITEMLLN